LHRLSDFQAVRNTEIDEGYLAFNVCSRLLYAKYFDTIAVINEFENWFHKLKDLAEENSELAMAFLITRIRRAIFYQQHADVHNFHDELEAHYDKGVAKLVNCEINFYFNTDRFNHCA